MTDVSQMNDTLQGGASPSETSTEKLKSQFSSLKSQASDKARSYADQGKARATDALDEAAKFLEDTARTVEEKMGPQFGRYGFSAAESVSSFATQMRSKDVEDLVEDARDLVAKSPAVAIGAAVAIGFVLARLAKAGAGFENAGTESSGSIPSGSSATSKAADFGTTNTGMGGAPSDSSSSVRDVPLPASTFPA